MTDDELKTFLRDLERKLLEPKRFIVFYSTSRGAEHHEYTRHIYAHTVRDAFDQFMIQNPPYDAGGRELLHTRIRHIEPWIESCEEWRPWESHPFPLGKKR